MKKRIAKALVLTSFLLSAAIVALAFVPHHTCACGQYEDGSQLTHFVNTASELIIGRTVIEKNPNPLK